MENQILENTTPQPINRPTFLIVLCILSWVWCAVPLYNGLNQVFGPSPRESMMKIAAASEKVEGKGKEFMDNTLEFFSANIEILERWTLPLGIISIICALLCIFGCAYMWKLKKIGFYIYLMGEIIPLILGLYMYFQMTMPASGGLTSLMMKGTTFASIFFALLFIFMYSRNFKYLRS